MKINPTLIRAVDRLSITEDQRQDLYVKILEYGGEMPDNPEAWVATLSKNMALDAKRRGRRRRELEEQHANQLRAVHGQDDTADPLEYMEYEELATAVEGLSQPMLDVLVAHYVEGRSVDDIAHADGVTPGVIYTRLSRARKQIKKGS